MAEQTLLRGPNVYQEVNPHEAQRQRGVKSKVYCLSSEEFQESVKKWMETGKIRISIQKEKT